jgi:4'-phosphopantetheinyl transferase
MSQARPVLQPGEIQLWRAPLDLSSDRLAALAAYLSPDERERAERFQFPELRRRFIAARGTLRQVLGRYAACQPVSLRFEYGPHGKPKLARATSPLDLRFNLAHSHELAVFAVALGREVGVDLEWLDRPLHEPEAIARRFFSPGEQRALLALPVAQRLSAFYDCWTRKEAFLKARGEGLTFPLAAFDVSLGPDEPAALLACRDGPAALARWALLAPEIAPGYRAALVFERPGLLSGCWDASR